MKKSYIFITMTAATFLIGCSTVSKTQKASINEQIKKPEIDSSYGDRMKLARKPYSYVAIDYMDVANGKEDLYLEVEKEWEKIHQMLAAEGKIIGWGLAKARENKFGYEYITWKLVRSRGDLDQTYDFENIEKLMGKEKYNNLMSKTSESREIVGSELLYLEDYTLPLLTNNDLDENINPKNLVFNFDFMTPSEGKTEEYINMEKNVFQQRHQIKSELNPDFLYWRLYSKVSYSGNANEASHRTLNIFRKDVEPLKGDEAEKAQAALPSFPEGLSVEKVMAMRTMERVTYDIILMTNPKNNAESIAWDELNGTWADNHNNGGYRTKTISPYKMDLRFYDKNGKETAKKIRPMAIIIKNGKKQFKTYGENGSTWTAEFDLIDNKWFEQKRGLLKDGKHTNHSPDQYWIYTKGTKPVNIDRSSFTKTGKDVDLVKSIIETYAAGKLDEYKALFTKDAKIMHNNNEEITISELVEIHKSHHNQISGPIKILSSNYEVVSTSNGNKYGHAWVKFENTYKNGEKAVTPVFVSFGINSDGKIYFENAFYDTATNPSNSAYNK